MLYRFFNLLLVPVRVVLFILFGLIGVFFVLFDFFILWPVSYLFFGREFPFFIDYFDWWIPFVFDDWLKR